MPEIRPIDVEGLREVWSGAEGRYNYFDIDAQTVAYWDAENQRIEITATTLTEKHIGLFRPVSITEATALFEDSWVSEEYRIALPFDPVGKTFIVSEYELPADDAWAVGIEVPEKTLFFCPIAPETGEILPFGGFGKPNGWGVNIVDQTRNMLNIKTADGEQLIQERTAISGKLVAIFKSGNPLKKLSGFGNRFPVHISFQGKPLLIINLQTGSDGRILYLSGE